MYIIQENLSDNNWYDRYQNNDYELIVEFFNNFKDKYPNSKFRIIEVFFYVWVMRTIFNSRD